MSAILDFQELGKHPSVPPTCNPLSGINFCAVLIKNYMLEWCSRTWPALEYEMKTMETSLLTNCCNCHTNSLVKWITFEKLKNIKGSFHVISPNDHALRSSIFLKVPSNVLSQLKRTDMKFEAKLTNSFGDTVILILGVGGPKWLPWNLTPFSSPNISQNNIPCNLKFTVHTTKLVGINHKHNKITISKIITMVTGMS